ncbi:site-specific integrase [Curtobacterium flaccumfaciens]|nr:site-specific integrase [Curtobacterium flaccumfaciens]
MKQHGTALDTKTTLDQWATHWLETVGKPNLKPNTLLSYESVARNWIVPTIGAKKVAFLKPSDVRIMTKAVADAGRTSATSRKAYQVLSLMLESARVEGIASRNVCEDVNAPVQGESNRGALSTDAALSVLKVAAEHDDGTRWWVALLSGLRQGERIGARLESLDLDSEQPTIGVEWALSEVPFEHGCGRLDDNTWRCGKKRAGSCSNRRLRIPDGFEYQQLNGRLCLIRPKSGKPRYVPLMPALAEALRRYLIKTADRPNPYGLIWRKPNGEPYLWGEDEQTWRDILFEAGIIADEDRKPGSPVPTTHWARHTTATVLMELGVDAKIVGHQSEAVTRRYQHVSSAAAREAMAKLGSHFALDAGPS